MLPLCWTCFPSPILHERTKPAVKKRHCNCCFRVSLHRQLLSPFSSKVRWSPQPVHTIAATWHDIIWMDQFNNLNALNLPYGLRLLTQWLYTAYSCFCFRMRPFLNHLKAKQKKLQAEIEKKENPQTPQPKTVVKTEPGSKKSRKWSIDLCDMFPSLRVHSQYFLISDQRENVWSL